MTDKLSTNIQDTLYEDGRKLRIIPGVGAHEVTLFVMDARGKEWPFAGGGFNASELYDAIDGAVGKRNAIDTAAETKSDWTHIGYLSEDGVGSTEAPAKGSDAKPYRPADRARLLRHIDDLQATLTRRNERHEADQERIRQLEVELVDARHDLAAQVQRAWELAKTKTTREYMDLAWKAAHVPADGMIHDGEPFLAKGAGEAFASAYGPAHSPRASGAGSYERRLMDPRPEPTEEEKRQALIEKSGLEDWELELLGVSTS